MSTFEESLTQACDSHEVPGAVVFCANRSGSFTYSRAFGSHTLSDPSTPKSLPYTPETPLWLFSCTKLLTSIAVLQLHERSLLDLDADVRSLLPALQDVKVLTAFDVDTQTPAFAPVRGPITTRQLITHAAGTFGWAEDHLWAYRKHVGTEGLIWGGKTVEERYGGPLAFQPGEAWAYGAGHDWAGKIVEKISGMTLEDYFQGNIVKPLGATSLTFRPADKTVFAGCVKRDNETGKVVNVERGTWPMTRMDECAGGGGCTGTMEDYGKVLVSLLRDDGALLKSETVKSMFSPQLSEAARRSLQQQRDAGGKMRNAGPGYYPDGVKFDWGLGAMLIHGGKQGEKRMVDGGVDNELGNAEWRGRGMLTWGGWPNLSWFVDREKGIVGIWGTQVLPTGDNEVRKWTLRWEKEIYKRAGLL